jgi:Gram-negative bacterial TonB protein C-terminal
MKRNGFVAILFILFIALNFQAQTTKRKKKTKRIAVIKSQTKKKNISKVISLGVVNGKALNLVRPEFSLAAKSVNVRGSVNVSILIDEEGNVIDAKAVSGHPLLRANSVSAALKSTFEPITIGGNPVRVRGIIVYNYISDTFNWLEIGNAFGEPRFTEMLPFKFEEEKQMSRQSQTADYENRLLIYQNLRAAIESKLIDDQKALWLFRVGIFLNEFPSNRRDEEDRKTDVAELQTLIANLPENVSQALLAKLKNLLNLLENPQLDTYSPQNGSKSYEQIQNIIEKLPLLGN